MAHLSFRVDLATGGRLGPGKRRLLQLIDDLGSISAAGRSMGMSYRRAWLLVEEVNGAFREPLVEKMPGGSGGGGAVLTSAGRDVLAWLADIEAKAEAAAAVSLKRLDALAAERPKSATAHD
ncbi:MAG: LysR family transcriptional regulator [Rhodospirillaceae bacterium]|nr:MAG: LysR family transcriptional regulator [Rhodospirillaceae bacterium]